MSRQRGRRERPAVERRAAIERYTKPARQRRARPEPGSRPTIRWGAVFAGTLISIGLYGLIANAVVQAADGNESVAGWNAAGAAALVPVLLLFLGFLTRAPAPWRTAAVVSALVVGVFLLGSFLARDIGSAYVLAVGAGASYAMRLDEAVHRRSWRLVVTVGLALYTKVVYLISEEIAIVVAPLLPIVAVALVDSVAERRAKP